MNFKYIIMAGGKYKKWGEKSKHLIEINGEPLVARTIRLLRENGVEDIAISTNNPGFEQFGIPILRHENNYMLGNEGEGSVNNWLDAFYPTDDPVCYLMGDVVFSPYAIKTIVETDTDDIQFFASAEPLAPEYPKKWAEPFGFKVINHTKFRECIAKALQYEKEGLFYRQPVSWELWQLIKRTPINRIDYNNYCAINDYTCDIDSPEDIQLFEGLIND